MTTMHEQHYCYKPRAEQQPKSMATAGLEAKPEVYSRTQSDAAGGCGQVERGMGQRQRC